jgi:hypothetical protein
MRQPQNTTNASTDKQILKPTAYRGQGMGMNGMVECHGDLHIYTPQKVQAESPILLCSP